jgi:hypothetical protein
MPSAPDCEEHSNQEYTRGGNTGTRSAPTCMGHRSSNDDEHDSHPDRSKHHQRAPTHTVDCGKRNEGAPELENICTCRENTSRDGGQSQQVGIYRRGVEANNANPVHLLEEGAKHSKEGPVQQTLVVLLK